MAVLPAMPWAVAMAAASSPNNRPAATAQEKCPATPVACKPWL